MARVELDEAALSPEQRRIFDAIASGPRGKVQGPLRVWLQSPMLADRGQALGAFCRFGSSLEPRLSELAILITGAYWKAGFEWHVHAPIGLQAGLDPAAVEAIRVRGTPSFARNDEAAIHDFARELLDRKRVSEPTYQRAKKELGERGVVDLVAILGYYGLISMTINAFEVELPLGAKDPFGDL